MAVSVLLFLFWFGLASASLTSLIKKQHHKPTISSIVKYDIYNNFSSFNHNPLLNVLPWVKEKSTDSYDKYFEEEAIPIFAMFLEKAVQSNDIMRYVSIIHQIPKEKLRRLAFGSRITGPLCKHIVNNPSKNNLKLLTAISERLDHTINPVYTCPLGQYNSGVELVKDISIQSKAHKQLVYRWVVNSFKEKNKSVRSLANGAAYRHRLSIGSILSAEEKGLILQHNPKLIRYATFKQEDLDLDVTLPIVMYASTNGYQALDATFIDYRQKCDISYYRTGATAAHYLSIQGHYGALKHFFSLKGCASAVDSRDVNYDTPLMMVLKHAQAYLNRPMQFLDTLYYTMTKVIQVLLLHGASLYKYNIEGKSALHLLVETGDIVLMEYFLHHIEFKEEDVRNLPEEYLNCLRVLMFNHALATRNKDIIAFLIVNCRGRESYLALKQKSNLAQFSGTDADGLSLITLIKSDYHQGKDYVFQQYSPNVPKWENLGFWEQVSSIFPKEKEGEKSQVAKVFQQCMERNDIKKSIWLKYYMLHHYIKSADVNFDITSYPDNILRRRRMLLRIWYYHISDKRMFNLHFLKGLHENNPLQHIFDHKNIWVTAEELGLTKQSLTKRIYEYEEQGYDINFTSPSGISVMHLALRLYDKDLVSFLLDRGAIVNNHVGHLALIEVALLMSTPIKLDKILKYGLLPELYNWRSMNFLKRAAMTMRDKFLPLMKDFVDASMASNPKYFEHFITDVSKVRIVYSKDIEQYVQPILQRKH